MSKPALVAKFKASKQFETLLALKDVGAKGAMAISKMDAMLKKLDADGDGQVQCTMADSATAAQ